MILAYIDPGSGYTIFSLGGWMLAFLLGFLGVVAVFWKKIFRLLKSRKKMFFILIAAVAAASLTIAGITMNRKDGDFDGRIIILGFDGLSPRIVEKMMEEGGLPNFSYLREKGSYARLATTNPPQSPVAWAGFATGRNPGKNGIFDFIERDPKTYRLSLSLSNIEGGKARRVIKSRCFWQYTSEDRIPTVILNHPVTFPPDRVYGRMLSGMGVPDILGTEGTFTFYTSEELEQDRDIGGRVFHVRRAPVMVMNLIGPRVAKPGKEAENVVVPFKASLEDGGLTIEYQEQSFHIEAGRWSDWKEVTFKLGLIKKAKGILKFHLVEAEPGFKLYLSPINFDPRDPFFQISHPKGYSGELAESIGLYHTQGMPMDTWAVNEKRLTEKPFMEMVEEIVGERRRMLDLELDRFARGVLFCYFESSDIVQHMFWRYTDSGHPLYEAGAPPEYRDMIANWYTKMDSLLGSVLEKITSSDLLIVLSDHGFDTFRRAVHVNSWLRENGYLQLENPYADSGRELLLDIDWSNTRAYSIGFGSIYINQEGREAEGMVEPGRETEFLKKEIAEKLLQWTDEKYDSPVVSGVYRREEIFRGDYESSTPDLCIGFNIGYRASWQSALGGAPQALIEDNLKKWSGTHLVDPKHIPGVLFCSRRGMRQDASIYDVVPTVLREIGYDDERLDACDLDGRPLFE